MIDWQVSDVLDRRAARTGRARTFAASPTCDSRQLIVRPSAELAEKKVGLERFLFDDVYRHPTVLAKRGEAQQALREMFDVLVRRPDRLPPKFRRLAERDGLHRAVADYLAGMTDRFAFEEHQRLVRPTERTFGVSAPTGEPLDRW